jgi:hypothetical protein
MSDQGRLTIDIKDRRTPEEVDMLRVLTEYMRTVRTYEGISYIDQIDDGALSMAEIALLRSVEMALEFEEGDDDARGC